MCPHDSATVGLFGTSIYKNIAGNGFTQRKLLLIFFRDFFGDKAVVYNLSRKVVPDFDHDRNDIGVITYISKVECMHIKKNFQDVRDVKIGEHDAFFLQTKSRHHGNSSPRSFQAFNFPHNQQQRIDKEVAPDALDTTLFQDTGRTNTTGSNDYFFGIGPVSFPTTLIFNTNSCAVFDNDLCHLCVVDYLGAIFNGFIYKITGVPFGVVGASVRARLAISFAFILVD